MKKVLLLAFAAGALHAADAVPDWLRQAAAQAVPEYPPKVATAVLVHEEVLTVDPDGRQVMRERGAVKILQQTDESFKTYRFYNSKNGRIRDFQGWLIPPSGKPVPYAKNRIADVAVSQEYIFDERAKLLTFGSAPSGSVFAWEVTEEEKTVFTQAEYSFQEAVAPVLTSRYVLSLPAGWEARGVVFNRDALEPQVSGSTYTWELRNLPWMEREDYSPPAGQRVPRLAVSYYPPSSNRMGLQGLKDWTSVSTWVSQLMDPSAEVTDAIRAKAMLLTAKAPGELDKIRAIASFTQQTNYVEVSLNLARGGGYTPHRADDTLAKNYGDCKDKSTLMRALLKAAGIDAYVTVIRSSDPDYVRPEWASPMQFDHAIVAVHVSESVSLPTVIESPSLGRLLMFDPTNRVTPVGDLPAQEQGSHALVLAGARGALLTMPLLPVNANRIESSVEAAVDVQGHLEAKVNRRYFGQSGSAVRGVGQLRGSDELQRTLERTWSRRVAAASLSGIEVSDHPDEDQLSLSLQLAADHFAQVMQNTLLVVRPGSLANGSDYGFSTKQRDTPVQLQAALRQDSIRIKVPAGLKLDEIPRPVKLESPYGKLEATWTLGNGEILFNQTLELRRVVAQPSEYAAVRDFFDRVNGAAVAPVVFAAK